jgi:RNA recognition motif-containing protein
MTGPAVFGTNLKSTFMSIKVYVNNLAAATTENELMDLFSAYGNVADVHIAVDGPNPRPRGSGFVTMVTAEGARAAIQALNGKVMGTGSLAVSGACPRDERASSQKG